MKKVIIALLILALGLGLWGCAERDDWEDWDDRDDREHEEDDPKPSKETKPTQETEPAPTEPVWADPAYDYDTQADVILANYEQWKTVSEYAMYNYYTVSDLDQDGLLEINCSCTMGTGIFTQWRIFEVKEGLDGLVMIAEDPENAPDGFISLEAEENDSTAPKIGYFDPEEKTFYYILQDVWRAGFESNGTVILSQCMVDNELRRENLGNHECKVDSKTYQETHSFKIGEQEYADKEALYQAMREEFADCKKFLYPTEGLNSNDITDLDAQIRALVKAYKITWVEG